LGSPELGEPGAEDVVVHAIAADLEEPLALDLHGLRRVAEEVTFFLQ
jgi:hypothetical protein